MDDLRLLGRLRRPAFSELSSQLMPLKWLGFVVVVGSGLALFMSDATRLYRNWAFLVKVVLLLVGGAERGNFSSGGLSRRREVGSGYRSTFRG